MEIEADPQGGWQLTFGVYDACNYEVPFRAMLATISEILGGDLKTDLRLPPYEVDEDFVEGWLMAGEALFRVYYEYSLSYLTLSCDHEASLRDAAQRIAPHVVIFPES